MYFVTYPLDPFAIYIFGFLGIDVGDWVINELVFSLLLFIIMKALENFFSLRAQTKLSLQSAWVASWTHHQDVRGGWSFKLREQHRHPSHPFVITGADSLSVAHSERWRAQTLQLRVAYLRYFRLCTLPWVSAPAAAPLSWRSTRPVAHRCPFRCRSLAVLSMRLLLLLVFAVAVQGNAPTSLPPARTQPPPGLGWRAARQGHAGWRGGWPGLRRRERGRTYWAGTPMHLLQMQQGLL